MTGTIQQLDQAIQHGQIRQAILLGEALLKASPNNQHVALSLSEAYRQSGKTAQARATASIAFETDTAFPFAQAQYLRCLMPYADHGAMMAVLGKAKSMSIADPWCLQVFSDSAVAIDEWQLAGDFLDQLERQTQGGQRAQAQYMRGVSYQVNGSNEQAMEKFEMAARLPAIAPRACWSMVSIEPDAVAAQQVQSLLDHTAVAEQDKRYLWQSLGQKHHKAKAHAEAFRCWQQANRLSQPLHTYARQHWERFFDQLKNGIQGVKTFSQQADRTVRQPPIFIVGLPRSGSTLVEQLLVASGEVQSLGELRDLEVAVQESLSQDIRPMPLNLDSDDWRRVAQSEVALRYQQRITSRIKKGQMPCDKNPANLLWLGLILKAWPDAKIIHVHKLPEAACLGVYRQLFAAAAPWSYRLDDIAHYYQQYQSLLNYWHDKLPGRILDVSYESFVQAPKEQGKRIFDYLGLVWHEGIVDGIGQQQASIPTASSSQVRTGLHTGYLDTWQPYKKQLEPFSKAIS